MLLPLILVIACLAGMAACPFVAFVIARRKYRNHMVERRKAVVVYYTVVVISFAVLVGTVKLLYPITSGFGDIVATALASIAVAALLAALLLGPFVALDLLQVAKILASQAGICLQCAYDLTGNSSGVCPECGTPREQMRRTTPRLRHRIRFLPWGRLLPVWLLIVVLVAGLLGYVRVTGAWICSECCLRESRVFHRFEVPFGGPAFFEIDGGIERASRRARPLTQLLDPHSQCGHGWVANGSSAESLAGTAWRRGPDYSGSVVEYEPDFVQFVNENPEVLSRIRISVGQRESIREWLLEEYIDWTESVDTAAPGD